MDPQSIIVSNQDIWQIALQNAFPLPASAFPPTSLPPGFLYNQQQYLATYHQSPNSDLNGSIFPQYPTTPGDGEIQPYPTLDFTQLLPLDQPHHSDSSVNDSQTLDEIFTDISSPQFTETSSLGRSPSLEQDTKRRQRKSSTTEASTKASRQSSKSRCKPRSASASASGSSNIDRIRERNRISAQRFRDKKKADAIDMELKTHRLSEQRGQLMAEITELQWQSIELQAKCLRQVMCGCDGLKEFFKNKTSTHAKLCQTELRSPTID